MSEYPAGFLYVCGPMTMYRDTDWNFPAFNRVAAYLRGMDFTVVNPAENFDGRTDLPRATYLRKAIEQVSHPSCVALVLLPNWQRSTGAQLEVSIATALGVDVQDYEDFIHVA